MGTWVTGGLGSAGGQLDSMILEGFSNLNNSVIVLKNSLEELVQRLQHGREVMYKVLHFKRKDPIQNGNNSLENITQ